MKVHDFYINFEMIWNYFNANSCNLYKNQSFIKFCAHINILLLICVYFEYFRSLKRQIEILKLKRSKYGINTIEIGKYKNTKKLYGNFGSFYK